MTPFTLDENVFTTTLSGISNFELDKKFEIWKNNTLSDFSDKIVQILNISFTECRNNYSINIVYRIGG